MLAVIMLLFHVHSHAIMKYLVSKYGGDKTEALYPSELRTRGLVDQCMFFNAGVFFKALGAVAVSFFIMLINIKLSAFLEVLS